MPPLLPFLVVGGIVLVLAVAYVVFALARSVPAPALSVPSSAWTIRGRTPRLAWPRHGQAAVTIERVGLLGVHGSARPTPIASVAKIMTAYLVLTDHPLRGGQQGPMLTVTAADAATFHHDAGLGQSVLPVRAGERLSERQALEGLLIPSGNNVASMLAAWDAGSLRAFVGRMNAATRSLGLSSTHYTDASGVAAGTVSTAGDQLHLAQIAFALPVFRAIVGMQQANLPVAGRQFNVDGLLGRDGIVGIKTGTTSQAGGCFVFAAHVRVARRTVTVIGAVLHQLPTRTQPSIIDAAFQATKSLLHSVAHSLRAATVVRRGETLAVLKAPWSAAVPLEASRSVRLVGWDGLPVQLIVPPANRLPARIRAGQVVGDADLSVGIRRYVIPLVAGSSLGGASLGWRLRHP